MHFVSAASKQTPVRQSPLNSNGNSKKVIHFWWKIMAARLLRFTFHQRHGPCTPRHYSQQTRDELSRPQVFWHPPRLFSTVPSAKRNRFHWRMCASCLLHLLLSRRSWSVRKCVLGWHRIQQSDTNWINIESIMTGSKRNSTSRRFSFRWPNRISRKTVVRTHKDPQACQLASNENTF